MNLMLFGYTVNLGAVVEQNSSLVKLVTPKQTTVSPVTQFTVSWLHPIKIHPLLRGRTQSKVGKST